MRVTILGSGTCVPRLERSSAAVLVESGPHKLLIDAGPGTMRRLLEAGRTIFDITHLLITHFHPDHSAELVPMLFATKYPDVQRRQTPLVIMGGQGLGRFYRKLQGPTVIGSSCPQTGCPFLNSQPGTAILSRWMNVGLRPMGWIIVPKAWPSDLKRGRDRY